VIRTLWYYLVLVATSILHGLPPVVAGLFGVKHRPGGVYDWATQDWSRQILAGAGTPVLVEGLERVPRGVPVVYASNHSSMFDIWALSAVLPGSTRFLAKRELARVPVIGPAMVAAGHIMIDREHKKRAFEAYERAAETIRRGLSAILFPEGTRSRTGELLPFKNAPFGLAIAAQVPLIPVYVHNTFQILPKGAVLLRPRPIRVLIGEPIATSGLTPADREALRDRTRAAMLALKARVDASPPAP